MSGKNTELLDSLAIKKTPQFLRSCTNIKPYAYVNCLRQTSSSLFIFFYIRLPMKISFFLCIIHFNINDNNPEFNLTVITFSPTTTLLPLT